MRGKALLSAAMMAAAVWASLPRLPQSVTNWEAEAIKVVLCRRKRAHFFASVASQSPKSSKSVLKLRNTFSMIFLV